MLSKIFYIFFIVIFFSYITFSDIEAKNFVEDKWGNFGWLSKIFLDKKIWLTTFSAIRLLFFWSLLWCRQKNTHCYEFLCKSLKRFPWKIFFADIVDLAFGQITFYRSSKSNWKKNVIFKIILTVENSFLQMYRNRTSFVTYWFLRIKWLFVKSVKITSQNNAQMFTKICL